MITATLYGRLARDPERMQPSNGGESYVRFSMAVETGRKDQDGNRITQFINISVFGKQGNVIQQYFQKGNRIVCHVRNIEARAYADQSGQPRASLQAVLTGIEFVETRADQEQSAPQPAAVPQMGTAAGYSAPRQAGATLPPGQVPGYRTACTDSSTTDAAGHEYCCPGHRSVGGLILCLICGVTRRI